MIVVLDSNVIISAANFGSPRSAPVLALERAVDSDVNATCDEIDAEMRRILLDKFDWPLTRIQQEFLRIHRRAIRVTLKNTVHLCRDPGDDKFLECAERARASLIVTGDKDLLSLSTYRRTRIVTPAAYLRI